MCHSQNEKIKAEVKGPSEHCGEPQGACETKGSNKFLQERQWFLPPSQGKGIERHLNYILNFIEKTT